MAINTVTAEECRSFVHAGKTLCLLDVRTPGEFGRVHALGAKLMPIDELDPAAVSAWRQRADDPVYVLCQSGGRAAKATERLTDAGLTGIYCVEGGTDAWEKIGLPIERGGGKVISLERQVRIGAGALVFIGSILAWTVHIYFLAIPAFVGAGLVFAGVTDFCGMGMMLAKMPWNRARSAGEGCSSRQ